MSSFFRSLRAELLKSKNSLAVWLSLAGTAANVVVFFLLHFFSSEWITAGTTPWWGFVNGHYAGVAFMMLPLYVIILCTLITFMEHRSGMWVNLYTLPIQRSRLYWSKLLFTLLLFVGAHLLFVLGLLLSGALMGLLRPETDLLRHAPDFSQIGLLAVQTVWVVFGLLGLHFWISWRFTHFIVPLLIGIIGFVTVSILGPAFYGNNFIPYAYPIQYMPAYQGEVTLARWWGAPYYVWLSPLYGVVFTALGLRDLGKRGITS